MVRSLVLVAVLFTATTVCAQDAPPSRPRLLIPLYVTHIALQVADFHSTRLALDAGHREANPFMSNLTSGQMLGAKLAAGTVMIVATEKLWKRHRLAAVGVMLASNTALAVIAARNYRIAGR